jgi:hypothetical protein
VSTDHEPESEIAPELRFPRLDGESEKQFVERFAEHLRMLRRQADDGKPHHRTGPT